MSFKFFIKVNLLCIHVLLALLSSSIVYGLSGFTYEKKKVDNHIIHLVTINPQDYRIQIVKSNDGKIGRETVSSMARRTKAEIAINGGFFDIGGERDGVPAGSLVIQGKPYNVEDQLQALLMIEPVGASNLLTILSANPKQHIKQGVSMISGVPMLLEKSEIPRDMNDNKTDFYQKAHARTAIGIRPDNKLIIVIAEHNYKRDLLAVTMGEVQSLMKEKGDTLSKKYNHETPASITLNELKEILKDEFSSSGGPQGLTMLELAKLMKEQGCQSAINLDGGGSSTLWLHDKIMNQTVGDKDERNGLSMQRAVSDAIVFIPRTES